MRWALQDAKNRFSEVVDWALQKGPQLVTRRGKDAVVVVSIEEFRKMKKPKSSLRGFFQQSPLYGFDLSLKRSPDPGRPVSL